MLMNRPTDSATPYIAISSLSCVKCYTFYIEQLTPCTEYIFLQILVYNNIRVYIYWLTSNKRFYDTYILKMYIQLKFRYIWIDQTNKYFARAIVGFTDDFDKKKNTRQ